MAALYPKAPIVERTFGCLNDFSSASLYLHLIRGPLKKILLLMFLEMVKFFLFTE